MTATDFIVGFITAAKPCRVTVSRMVWARLILENCDPLPYLPWTDTGRTFCGIPIGPREAGV